MVTSEILAIAALIGCTSAPVILIIVFAMAYQMFRQHLKKKAEIKRLETRVATLTGTSHNLLKHLWLEEIQKNEYASELEVEAKFVYPLMRHLGWNADAVKMRVPTSIQVGRESVRAIADWVVYSDGKPAMVIEVKSKTENISSDTKNQARSYCYGLNITKYMLTNGREIKVYERGLDNDLLLFETSIEDLPVKWNQLHKFAGCAHK